MNLAKAGGPGWAFARRNGGCKTLPEAECYTKQERIGSQKAFCLQAFVLNWLNIQALMARREVG